MPGLRISGGFGEISPPDVPLPGCAAAKFCLGMIGIPAKLRAHLCGSFVTCCKQLYFSKNECNGSL